MTTKTKAEELAAALENAPTHESQSYVVIGWSNCGEDPLTEAAAELRRLAGVEAERDALVSAIGNQQLAAFIEKHGDPVPIVAERDRLAAEFEALRAKAATEDELRHVHRVLDEDRYALVQCHAVGGDVDGLDTEGHAAYLDYTRAIETMLKLIDSARKEQG